VNGDWRPGICLADLSARARMMREIRHFFEQREVMEVDTPSLSAYPAIDANIEPVTVLRRRTGKTQYLITSPEFHMKRLLCAGAGSIFQLCHAFREDEVGRLHNPEFTILEWYRVGWDHRQLMMEVDQLVGDLLGTRPAEYVAYRSLFEHWFGIDPLTMSVADFRGCCERWGLSPPSDLELSAARRDDRLNFLMGAFIEPRLGADRPVFVTDFPATQAALARIHPEDSRLCLRFELFFQGMELANGFMELADPALQVDRFAGENAVRNRSGRSVLPVDLRLIEALRNGLPDCAGVALGVDRVLMLRLNRSSIDEVLCFAGTRA
jgi:elongation factor P--(R)-beta-lysine ligase